MRIGIATDHGGYGLKQELVVQLRVAGHELIDFGAHSLCVDDDYPDYVTPLARAVAAGHRAACFAWREGSTSRTARARSRPICHANGDQGLDA